MLRASHLQLEDYEFVPFGFIKPFEVRSLGEHAFQTCEHHATTVTLLNHRCYRNIET